MIGQLRSALALAAIAGLAIPAQSQIIHDEIEPNDNKPQALANPVFVLAPGDGISGLTTGTGTGGSGAANTADYFVIGTQAAAPGIYDYRMLLADDSPSWAVTLRGLTRTAGIPNPGTDGQVQANITSGTPRRFVRWYGFGDQEQIFYRITGGSGTNFPYTATLSRTPVQPINLGTFQTGTIEITTAGQGHTTNTSLWILDSNFNLIPDAGNDLQPAPGTGNTSRLTRDFSDPQLFGPGTYYMALTIGPLALSLDAPFDDRRQNALALDFPGAVASGSTATTGNLAFQVTDAYGPLNFPAERNERFEINWYTFTVGTVSTSPFGRCCFRDGSCLFTGETQCANLDGTWGGTGTDCAGPGACPQRGACCVGGDGGYCQLALASECDSLAGTFLGENTECAQCPGRTCFWSSPPDSGMDNWIFALEEFNGELYAAGAFLNVGNVQANRIARWDGQTWSPLGSGANAQIFTLGVAEVAGSGTSLYVGGDLSQAGGIPVNWIARWDGQDWSALATGLQTEVTGFVSFDDGTGPALFVAAAIGTEWAVKWDGQGWSILPGLPTWSDTVTVFDNGGGQALYWGGGFQNAAGLPGTRGIAHRTGSSWASVGGGTNGSVRKLRVFDLGSGPALYATGTFTEAGSAPAARIATWNGQMWSALGDGFNSSGADMEIFDDGTGPALYAAGDFITAGGIDASRIARWDGQAWSPLGAGTNASISALIAFDDGSGPALYAGGAFTEAGGVAASRFARWQCTTAGPACYANCDNSTVEPILNVEDFVCFIDRFAEGLALTHTQQLTHYANCDNSTTQPVLNVEDFICFINEFANGCP
jgi:hypothetical protein